MRPRPGRRICFATFTPPSKPQPAVAQKQASVVHEKKQWTELIAGMDDREVVLAYFSKLGGSIKEEYVEQDINNIVRENFGGDQEAFEQSVREMGLTLEQFKKERLETMIVAVMKARATKDINIADPKERALAKERAFKEWIQDLREDKVR